jgi:hypothetical protein
LWVPAAIILTDLLAVGACSQLPVWSGASQDGDGDDDDGCVREKKEQQSSSMCLSYSFVLSLTVRPDRTFHALPGTAANAMPRPGGARRRLEGGASSGPSPLLAVDDRDMTTRWQAPDASFLIPLSL